MKVEISDRVCPHCGGTIWIRSKSNYGFKYKCHKKDMLSRAARMQRIKEDPILNQIYLERSRNANRQSYQKHKDVVLQRCKEYRAIALTPAKKQIRHANARRLRNELHPSIMRAGLKSLGIDSPSAEQIERYRTYLKTLRQWRQVKNQLQ